MSHQPPDPLDEWLLGDEAAKWLDELRTADQPTHQIATRLRKHLSAEQAHRLMELAELRQRAAQKFTAAERMFFTRVGFEQSSDEWIARYKAQRFVGRDLVADLCCGIGGDALGLADVARELTLVDRSPTMTAFAARNLMENGVETQVVAKTVGADSLDLQQCGAWHIDPDRRPEGGRTTHAELHEPSDATIDAMLAANPNAAVKLAPACQPPARWAEGGELEWISRSGECKQLVAWFGDLATQPGRRRATVLEVDGRGVRALASATGTGDQQPDADDRVGRYVMEPDAAVLASDLVGNLANEHGWWTFSSTTGYLSADAMKIDPAWTTFEVLDVVPLNIKRLSAYLRQRGIGQLEIKHRAVKLSPESLRKDLKLKGDEHATLLITRVLEKRIAIVARRVIAER
ncbi:class I SAM-dependent methyltransferase [Aeoliella sp.]|uniref:class I SAM-dependent methyltransferase n=1 Tax=Aeoliella sp. TaxID=2795800 RepID=UPI003CCB7458